MSNMKQFSTAQLRGSAMNLRHAKEHRQGGLLDGEKAALTEIDHELLMRKYTEQVEKAITQDIKDGCVPGDVKNFSELHESVDANMYLVDAMPDVEVDINNMDQFNEVMDRVDMWLKNGRK